MESILDFYYGNSSHQNEAGTFKINDRQFILVNQSRTSDRAFDRLWTEKLTNKMDSSFEFTNPVNFLQDIGMRVSEWILTSKAS